VWSGVSMVSSMVRHGAPKRIAGREVSQRGYAHIAPPSLRVWSIYASRSRPERVLRRSREVVAEIDWKTVIGPKGYVGKAGQAASAVWLDALAEIALAGGAHHAKPFIVDGQTVGVSSRLSGQGRSIRFRGFGTHPTCRM